MDNQLIDVNSRSIHRQRPRCNSLGSNASNTSTKTPVKPTRVELGKCPCLKSNETSWKVKCSSCRQTWHTMCANLKAKTIPESVIINMEKTWMCPWCFSTPLCRPSGHPSFKNESQLMGTAISDVVGERLAEEVSHNIVPQFQLAVENITNVRIKEISKMIEAQGKDFANGIKELENLKKLLISTSDRSVPNTATHTSVPIVSQSPPNNLNVNPTNHIEDYTEGFLSTEEVTNLKSALENEINYSSVNGRQVASFGASYKYTGSPKTNSPTIPNYLQTIIDKIHGEELYSDAQINQVVVNRYSGRTHLPEHADNEPAIRPDSHVFTITIGQQAPITFRDNILGGEEALTPTDGSLYVMSKSSQHYWTHRMEEVDLEEATRISVTLRSVGENYKNSTVILGDSNTKHLKFSTGTRGEKGTFGYKLPGKRIETFHISDINPSKCIGYQNIVIHCGINDLRDSSPGRLPTDPEPTNVQAHFSRITEKISEVKNVCPYASIHVSPILPTRNLKLNERVVQFNHLLFDYLANDPRGEGVRSLNLSEFVDEKTGVLRDDLRVWDSRAGCYNKRDILHIGRAGIRLLAGCVRNAVMNKFTTSRSYSGVIQNSRSYPSLLS